MHIRPLYDRIVVKRIEEKETKVGGLFIPDSAKEKPQEGEVVAVGQGKRNDEGKLIPLDVKAGDRIWAHGQFELFQFGSWQAAPTGGFTMEVSRKLLPLPGGTAFWATAAKLAAGILGHSHALVADAVESLADIFSSIVVWRGLVVASEPTYGGKPTGS